MKANTEELQGQIQSHPDVNLLFYPGRKYINTKFYKFDFPESANYRLGVLIDPCRMNKYNCWLEQERIAKYPVIAPDAEVSKNTYLIYEDGGNVDVNEQRTADDFTVYNETCTGLNTPDTSCQGRNYQFVRSPLRAPCMDNNRSLDALAGCEDPVTGEKREKCVQVAYSSNTFIPQCKAEALDDDNCGTYLEVHIAHGTPYTNESDILSYTQINTRNVSGFYTTTLNMTFMGNQSKVLCAYTESGESWEDNWRSYTKPCPQVYKDNPTEDRSWTSSQMLGRYDAVCPYFDSCAITLDAGKCRFTDRRFTFVGKVGVVTAVDNEAIIPKSWSTVSKRKGFNITSPACTFDNTNNRYFPYAILDNQGKPLDSSLYP
eukprot:gene23227-28213_t